MKPVINVGVNDIAGTSFTFRPSPQTARAMGREAKSVTISFNETGLNLPQLGKTRLDAVTTVLVGRDSQDVDFKFP